MGCTLCPRECDIDRSERRGACGADNTVRVAHSMLHMWEEPPISGENGSGAVFFSGCPLRCVYCQNKKISSSYDGEAYSEKQLAELFLSFQERGAHNINLVTAAHVADAVHKALIIAKNGGLTLPVVYNTSGYERAETLKKLSGLVDIYLSDFRYMDAERAKRYSKAQNYPDAAKRAFDEMFSQTGEAAIENGLMKRGVIARVLLLPRGVADAKRIVRYLYDRYGDAVYLSLMSQYTPACLAEGYDEINRRVTKREYERLCDFAVKIGVKNAFIQEREAASESYIPEFK